MKAIQCKEAGHKTRSTRGVFFQWFIVKKNPSNSPKFSWYAKLGPINWIFQVLSQLQHGFKPRQASPYPFLCHLCWSKNLPFHVAHDQFVRRECWAPDPFCSMELSRVHSKFILFSFITVMISNIVIKNIIMACVTSVPLQLPKALWHTISRSPGWRSGRTCSLAAGARQPPHDPKPRHRSVEHQRFCYQVQGTCNKSRLS